MTLPKLMFALIAAAGTLVVGCRPPAPPKDIARAEQCSAVPDDDAIGALYTSTVHRVDRIERLTHKRGFDEYEAQGAEVRLRNVQGDEALIANALACHAARAHVPALSRVAPAEDPLRPTGGGGDAWVAVKRDGADLIVRLTSEREDVAEEIYARAQRLSSPARK